MKKLLFVAVLCSMFVYSAWAEEKTTGNKIILLISEQNISGPQTAWWASAVDLSATEAELAGKLSEAGFTILEPSVLSGMVKNNPAFRMIDMSTDQSVKLARLAKADYVLSGKAVASSGAAIPSSRMISCFANMTAKLIKVQDGTVVVYLNAAGNSAHMDVISGGREALQRAADDASVKIIEALNKTTVCKENK